MNPQGTAAIPQQGRGPQQVEAQQRFVDVHLQMAATPRHGDGIALAQHLHRGHGHGFALGGVHLAGHDGTPRLVGGEPQFTKTGPGTRGQQTDVVDNFVQTHGQLADAVHQVHQGVVTPHRRKAIGGHVPVVPTPLAQMFTYQFSKPLWRTQARPHRRATQGQGVETRQGVPQPPFGILQLGCPAPHLLGHGEGHRVLKVGAADFHHVRPLGRLGGHGGDQLRQAGQQLLLHTVSRGQVNGRGEHVVGGLGAVHVVVGMDGPLPAPLPTTQFRSPVGDHLVHVHVGLGAAAALPHTQGEVIVKPAGQHLLTGGHNPAAALLVQHAKPGIAEGRRLLDAPQGVDDRHGHPVRADGKAANGPLGLGAPIVLGRHRHRPQAVGFQAGGISHGEGMPLPATSLPCHCCATPAPTSLDSRRGGGAHGPAGGCDPTGAGPWRYRQSRPR